MQKCAKNARVIIWTWCGSFGLLCWTQPWITRWPDSNILELSWVTVNLQHHLAIRVGSHCFTLKFNWLAYWKNCGTVTSIVVMSNFHYYSNKFSMIKIQHVHASLCWYACPVSLHYISSYLMFIDCELFGMKDINVFYKLIIPNCYPHNLMETPKWKTNLEINPLRHVL